MNTKLKKNIFISLLIAFAVVSAAVSSMQNLLPGIFTAALAFPFEQIGFGLRALSLSGNAGNIAAFILYIAISALPTAGLFLISKKRRLCPEDSLMAILSIVLLFVLYMMINPGLFNDVGIYKSFPGGITYSVIVGYLILKLVRNFNDVSLKGMHRHLKIFLLAICPVLVYGIFGAELSALIGSVNSLSVNNTEHNFQFGLTVLFMVLRYLTAALSYALGLVIVFLLISVIDNFKNDRYSDDSIASVEKLAKWSKNTLIISTLAGVGTNLLQLLFIRMLLDIHGNLSLPILPIIFSLAAMLFARYIKDSKKIKDENDMFI